MGIPLMIRDIDNQHIENLKKILHFHKKIDVVRAGLALLEKEANCQQNKIERRKQAAKLVAANSHEINKEFQPYSRIKSA